MIWINGYGWPVYLGGPMFYADQIGLKKILDSLKEYQKEHGDAWKPSALLEDLVANGKSFADLN